ncbi:MAG TPA: acetylornithine/succinylornithine family transaminase [Xanthomonadaceae bacterium]|nr:acetylornithine/succinylornithine family transaminase [Xanthomonadaceae bacterium]
MSSTAELVESARIHAWPIYRPRAVIIERGQGARVWDSDGREYVDFAAGIAVSALGHGDPELLAALNTQAGHIWHTSNVFLNAPAVHLGEELAAASGFAARVFLCNSGAEANEAAIKLVRRWATAQGRLPGRREILTFRGGFHGRTLATLTATAQPRYQEGYEPLPGGFRYADINDASAVEAALAGGGVAAVLVEPVQGEGGVMPLAEGFLRFLREACDRHGALLVLDEIQCGMGRTGRLFAHQWEGVVPDILTLAKALGCGMPIGATLARPEVAEAMGFGAHGTTFGGNPLAAAVARVALRRLSSPELLTHVQRQSLALRQGLAAVDAELGVFREIRGMGLMLGAELRSEHAGRAGEVLDHAAAAGLLLLQAGPDVLRLVPPLILTDSDVSDGLARLRTALTPLAA